VKTIRHGLVVLVLASSAASPAPQDPPSPSPDTTSLAPDGTARITRVVPVPTTISPQAQAFLRTGASWAPAPGSEEQRLLIEKARVLYPVRIEDAVIGGVPFRVVTVLYRLAPANRFPAAVDDVIALLRNGVDARLVVFDAMPHAHWYMMGIPEATEALELMARFFDERLGR
jgi:hypothetical protein